MADDVPYYYDSLGIQVLSKLGSGTYGDVYKVQYGYERDEYAMKIFKGVCPIPPTEIDIPSRIRSPYISRVMHIIHHKEDHNENVFLLYKLCNNSIRNFVKDMDDKNLIDKIEVFHKILQGVYALHVNKIIHMDIKIDNILITSDGETTTPHIIDFGLSRYTGNINVGIDFGHLSKRVFGMGTPTYLPPEHFRGKNIYGGFTDIWSLGILALRMFTGQKLVPNEIKKDDISDYIAVFDNEDDIKKRLDDLFEKIPKGKNYTNFKKKIKDLIRAMLNSDPKMRPTVQELLGHSLFDNMTNEISFNYVLSDNLSYLTTPPLNVINIIVEYYTTRSIFEMEKNIAPTSRSLAIHFFEAVNLAYKTLNMANKKIINKETNQRAIGLACVVLTLGKSCVEPKAIIKRLGRRDITLKSLETWIKYIINNTHGVLRSDTTLFHHGNDLNDLNFYLEDTIHKPAKYVATMGSNLSTNPLNGFITFDDIMGNLF